MTANGSTLLTASLLVPGDHPALAGHFPGNPIVPGVLILEHVLELVETRQRCDVAEAHVRHVKFLSPLLPGRVAIITIRTSPDGHVFSVASDDALIASGTIELGRQTKP